LDERTRERVPHLRAESQNNLGIALETLGGRESGAARLEEAIAAYRNALQENTRARRLIKGFFLYVTRLPFNSNRAELRGLLLSP
jgi:hypothetical protein